MNILTLKEKHQNLVKNLFYIELNKLTIMFQSWDAQRSEVWFCSHGTSWNEPSPNIHPAPAYSSTQ